MGKGFFAGCLFMLGGIIIAVVLYTRLEGWEKFFFILLDVLQESSRWVLLIIGSGFLCWLLGAILIRKQ
jgi:hypothetical protein